MIIVAELPDANKVTTAVQLINPRLLEIGCKREQDSEEKSAGYNFRQRMSHSLSRLVTLPSDVFEDDGKARFRNGILKVRLKKRTMLKKSRILIE